MEIFINGVGVISPLKGNCLTEIQEAMLPSVEKGYMKCSEPDYKKFINPVAARRMSRAVKMGIFSAKTCLDDAGIEMPDAVVTGTGLGCIEDTEKFLISVINNNEKLLSPTPFIQSTHNTVGSQISILLKCHGYNVTYSHRALSFESALIDAGMLLNESGVQNILLGGIDEITDISLNLQQRMGIYKSNGASSFSDNNSRGSFAGEAAVFFIASAKPSSKSYAKITSLKTITGQFDADSLKISAEKFMIENKIDVKEINLAVLGYSGNPITDSLYDSLSEGIFSKTSTAYYKHLCGEYHTSSAFSLALASEILKKNKVPEIVRRNSVPVSDVKNILIYNHFQNESHSFLLIRNV